MLARWQFVSRRLERSIPKQRRHAIASSPYSAQWDSIRKRPNVRRLSPSRERVKKSGYRIRRNRTLSFSETGEKPHDGERQLASLGKVQCERMVLDSWNRPTVSP